MSGDSILFGSTNQGKLVEVRVAAACMHRSVLSLADIDSRNGPCPEVVEGEAHYEGNSRKKAVQYAKWAERSCIADDTGMEILGFGGFPGVYTARYGLQRLMSEILPHVKHAARFVCCMSYGEPCGRVVSVTAELPGYFYFDRERAAPSGSLPFSHYFYPYGKKEPQSLAHLVSEGGYPSHRVRALGELLKVLS